MNAQTQNFDELMGKLQARERAAWRSSLLWSVVPVLLALAFLGYATLHLAAANKEVSGLQAQADTYRGEVERLKGEAASMKLEVAQAREASQKLQLEVAQSTARIAAMQDEIATLRKQLQATLDLAKFEHSVDMVDLKMFFSRHPQAGQILDKILEMRRQGVGWHLRGQTPEQGFDSPGFAAYILQQSGLLPREKGESLLAASRQLYNRLKPTNDPQVGDLVAYPAGFLMFLFEDKQRQRYVIGMTPSGIIALKPDFAKVVGYRKVR